MLASVKIHTPNFLVKSYILMNVIGNILPISHIALQSDATSKKRLFEQLASLLATDNEMPKDEIFNCLISREKLGSTGLGQGVAIPHGRSACVKEATGAFIRLPEAIEFESPDNMPVSLVFALIVPEESTSEHLAILSHLAERFSEKSIRDALLACQTEDKVWQILCT